MGLFHHNKDSGPAIKLENSSVAKKNADTTADIVINSIADGVVVIDAAGDIELFNPAAARITGWEAKDAIKLNHKNVFQLTDEKDTPYTDTQNPFVLVLHNKETCKDDIAILKTRNDKKINFSITLSPLLDKDNVLTGAVGVFRDITEERNAEKQRAEFISTASHEMRTPVAAIEGYLALALNDKVSKIDSKAREFLEKAHMSTQHLGKLFQDLLTATKSEDGRLSNHPIVVEIGQFLEQLTQDMKFAAEKRGLGVEYVLGSQSNTIDARNGGEKVVKPLYFIHADPERLREVITNLFDNAVKYTETGKIIIGLTGNNEVVQIRVSDTGTGIPTEDIPHLFQKFYRVDNSATRAIGGTGLGLFICRKIVELYHGHIWVDSTLGKGSTFYINLPRLSADQAQQLQIDEARTIPPVTPSGPTVS